MLSVYSSNINERMPTENTFHKKKKENKFAHKIGIIIEYFDESDTTIDLQVQLENKLLGVQR